MFVYYPKRALRGEICTLFERLQRSCNFLNLNPGHSRYEAIGTFHLIAVRAGQLLALGSTVLNFATIAQEFGGITRGALENDSLQVDNLKR